MKKIVSKALKHVLNEQQDPKYSGLGPTTKVDLAWRAIIELQDEDVLLETIREVDNSTSEQSLLDEAEDVLFSFPEGTIVKDVIEL